MKRLILVCGAAVALSSSPAPAFADPGHGHGQGHAFGHRDEGNGEGYGSGACPPGLRSKGCMPPGQAKKLARGERYENGYGALYTYQRLPYDLRRRYRLSARYRYYYENGTVYVVDPRTMLIAQVISTLLR